MDYTDRLSAQRGAGTPLPWLAGAAPLLLALPALAVPPPPTELADLSIEELAHIQIISVSKKPERLADAAASVFVITAEDIRRAGAASVPEALRLAPSLQVARTSNSSYAISARGLNGAVGASPNKLLVLIDGRSVYTPLFSGVFWDVQDVVLEDVERIEVISGPGGTLWGVNAVNGVINIITRGAADTQGSLLALQGGRRGYDAAFRYGGKAGAQGSYRVYGKFDDRSHTDLVRGGPVNDALHKGQIGFRADWTQPGEQVMVQGNAYRGSDAQPAPGLVQTGAKVVLGAVTVSGANLTGQWTHALDGGASLGLQAYYDRSLRDVAPFFAETLDIADLQLQHSLAPWGAHALVWGANLRYSRDRVNNSAYIAFLPGELNQRWLSLFAQDELSLAPDWRLTAGGRLERNDYTGTEFLPTLRLAWKPAPAHTLWGAASRTVRAPSRQDADVRVPGVPPFVLDGGPAVRSEVATVAELGYRGQPRADLSYSVTLFHNNYDHMRTLALGPTRKNYVYGNAMEGRANGIETWGNYQVLPSWRLSAGLVALHEKFTLKPGAIDVGAPTAAGYDPARTLHLRSDFTLAPGREFEIAVRRVGSLSAFKVPAYTALDARLGWKLGPKLDLSVSGQNLNGGHSEYSGAATRSEFARSLAVKLVWQG